MKRLLYRWQYSFFKVQSYLAHNMGDTISYSNSESAADEAKRLYHRETIQP